MSDVENGTPEDAKPNSGRGARVAIAGVVAVGLLAGGVFAGMAMADPTKSEEYATAVKHVQVAGADRDNYRNQLAELTTKHQELETGIEEREAALGERESALGVRESGLDESEAAVKAREKAVGTAEAEAEANAVSDGTWTVGEDIKAGTYRTTSNVGARCYWGIYRSGSNGGDIIENDIPGGGKPTVKLSKGQDFKSSNCGDWQKK